MPQLATPDAGTVALGRPPSNGNGREKSGSVPGDARAFGAGAARAAGPDLPRIERAVREILAALGEDPDRDGLAETPARVARAYGEICGGLWQEAGTHLARTFEHAGEGDVVTLRNVEFFSLCEHHLLPFKGHVHVAYLPGPDRVVGLSKLARTVEVFARRPQLQERLTAQIADALVEHLDPRGVTVVAQAEHMCMQMRGVGKTEPVMTTAAHRGVCRWEPATRVEVLRLLGID